jgi:hypothetical protein
MDHIVYGVYSKNCNDILVKDPLTDQGIYFLDVTLKFFRGTQLSFHYGESKSAPIIFKITNRTRLLGSDSYILTPPPDIFSALHQPPSRFPQSTLSLIVKTHFLAYYFEFGYQGETYQWRLCGIKGYLKLVRSSHTDRVIAGLVSVIKYNRHIGKLRILKAYEHLKDIIVVTCLLVQKDIELRL